MVNSWRNTFVNILLTQKYLSSLNLLGLICNSIKYEKNDRSSFQIRQAKTITINQRSSNKNSIKLSFDRPLYRIYRRIEENKKLKEKKKRKKKRKNLIK